MGPNKKEVLKSKINSVARINRMYTTLREESEMHLKIKNISVARHLTVSSQQRSIIPTSLQSVMRESILICERL